MAAFFLVVCACSSAPREPVAGGAGESCMKPFRLEPSSGTFTFTTAGFKDDEGNARSACGGDGSPDAVFELAVPNGGLVSIKVTPTDLDFQPVLKVRGASTGCVAQDEQCDAAIGKGKPAELTDWPPAIGGYQYVIVDGLNGTSGTFTLAVSQR